MIKHKSRGEGWPEMGAVKQRLKWSQKIMPGSGSRWRGWHNSQEALRGNMPIMFRSAEGQCGWIAISWAGEWLKMKEKPKGIHN